MAAGMEAWPIRHPPTAARPMSGETGESLAQLRAQRDQVAAHRKSLDAMLMQRNIFIRKARAAGLSYGRIALAAGLTQQMVWRIATGRGGRQAA